jgi:hypothetical protein
VDGKSGEIDTLARAPYFVHDPAALRDVRDEMLRIRLGKGSKDKPLDPVIDNARALATTLESAGRELSHIEVEDVELFARERLVEALPALPLSHPVVAREIG